MTGLCPCAALFGLASGNRCCVGQPMSWLPGCSASRRSAWSSWTSPFLPSAHLLPTTAPAEAWHHRQVFGVPPRPKPTRPWEGQSWRGVSASSSLVDRGSRQRGRTPLRQQPAALPTCVPAPAVACPQRWRRSSARQSPAHLRAAAAQCAGGLAAAVTRRQGQQRT